MHIEKRKNRNFDFPKYFDDESTRLKFDLSLLNVASLGTTLPAVNVNEVEENYVVEMAAPGLQPNDFIVGLDNDILTIKANPSLSKRSKSHRREHNYRGFIRTLRLPADIKLKSKVEAIYENGILEITIPKAA